MTAAFVARRLSAALQGRNVLQLLSEVARRGAHAGCHAVQRHVLRRRYIEKRVNDYRLLLDSRDPGISRQLLNRGTRELEQRHLVEHVLRPGMTAFDLGANVGYYTVMMARLVGESGRVYAVEPFPDSFRLLEGNIHRNRLRNVLVENVAIGASDGEEQLLLAEKSNWHSLHAPQLDPQVGWHAKYTRDFVGSIAIRTRSLATYLSGKGPIQLLRMDLEGYETEILKSVIDLPRAQTSELRILFETHPEFYDPARNDMRSVLERLCGRQGYGIEYLISDFQHGSRWERRAETGRAAFERYGYTDAHIVAQFRNRAIYGNLRTADAIDLICSSECVHAALLAPGR